MKKINHGLEIIFSIGAALVILGAYGKIIHASWGGFMLSVGMITEVFLFLATGVILIFDKPSKTITPTYTALEISELQNKISSLNKSLSTIELDGNELQYQFVTLSKNLAETNKVLGGIANAVKR
jgi:hypothetical protein